MPLYLDPNALYRISSANRTGNLKGESSGDNKKNSAKVFTAMPNLNSPTLANISMREPAPSAGDADKGQYWMFRWVNGIQPEGFYWTLHNPFSGLNKCIERNNDGTLKYGDIPSGSKPTDSQIWYVEIAPTGNAKWMLQDRTQSSKLDIRANSSQVAFLNDGSGENTLWSLEYVRPASGISGDEIKI